MTTVEQFEGRVRAWIQNHQADLAAAVSDDELRRMLTADLFDEGLSAATWPTQYGGLDLGPEFQTAFNRVFNAYSWLMPSAVTVGICAPVILEMGADDIRDRYLRSMLRGDQTWTQLLSEPNAGSDLANISTRAVMDGDQWIINGQKVWTSEAHTSDFALALVRTDPGSRRQAGLTMLIVDLRSEGVDIRPLREMTGDSLFNEVFLTDVVVPGGSVVGEVDNGWAVLSKLLYHERMALSAGTTASKTMKYFAVEELVAIARRNGTLQEPEFRRPLADFAIQERLLELLGIRIREAMEAGHDIGLAGSLGKIGLAGLAHLSAECSAIAGGMSTVAWERDGDSNGYAASQNLLRFPMAGIAGGTTEIQKNAVAERVVGLPRG